ncbi:efflux RND transporter periplasmic adaptor subunit [Desulfatibacillum aliphaticivorans]|uniref:efflux RND transporter periplasmic adaptor subunit n=1 Tax=Desulfatibacillum aliphaticivorans TaxID=218208 RepID=UPI0003F69B64|nr:efflux RND transporter periplasmic adaptor subunit [Desulfatibacillum aliphaticivorans]
MTFLKWIWKILRVLLMVCGAAFIVFAARNFLSAPKPPSQERSPFQTAMVNKGAVETLVSSTGTLAAVGTVEVGTQVSGTIDRVLADYNDKVTKGQILAEMDTSLFEASIKQADAALAQAKAKLRQAKAEYDRNKPLFEKGHLSAQEFLTYETEKETAAASVLSSQAALDTAKTNLRNAVIKSPIDGTVIERAIEEGQTVAASYSTPTLFLIAEDLSDMQIEAAVDESDIGQIREGMPVRFTVQAYPDDEFTGVVLQIRLNPEVVSNVVTYTVVIEAPNETGTLLPGMTATIEFIVQQIKDQLLVPNSALSFAKSEMAGPDAGASDGPAVMISNNGSMPRRVSLETGITDGANTVVLAGAIQEGDRVVTGIKKEQSASKQSILSRLMPRPSRRSGGGGPPPGP